MRAVDVRDGKRGKGTATSARRGKMYVNSPAEVVVKFGVIVQIMVRGLMRRPHSFIVSNLGKERKLGCSAVGL
jgi:hypothetical protein